MDADLALHAAVAAFAAFSFGAVGLTLARAGTASRGYLAWWLAGAGSQTAAAASLSLATLGVEAPTVDVALVALFLLAGCVAAVGIILHVLHLLTQETRGAVAILLLAGLAAFLVTGAAFLPSGLVGALSAALSPTDPLLSRALLGHALVAQGLPFIAALGTLGAACASGGRHACERAAFTGGALATWAASGLFATLTSILAIPVGHFAALALFVVGVALCACCHLPPPWLARRLPA